MGGSRGGGGGGEGDGMRQKGIYGDVRGCIER